VYGAEELSKERPHLVDQRYHHMPKSGERLLVRVTSRGIVRGQLSKFTIMSVNADQKRGLI
jgi:hypothetical protein